MGLDINAKFKELMTDYPLVTDAPIIQEYKDILSMKVQKFQNGTWKKPNAHYYANLVIRYLLEEKLDLALKEMINVRSKQFNKKWKINGLVTCVYNGSVQKAILDVYGEFLPRDVSITEIFNRPHDFYEDKDNRIKVFKWLIFTKLNIRSKEGFLERFTKKNLDDHVRGIRSYHDSMNEIYLFLQEEKVIPWSILPWESYKRNDSLWKEESNRVKATVWFFEEFLNIEKGPIATSHFTYRDIVNAKLIDLYVQYFRDVYSDPKDKLIEYYLRHKNSNLRCEASFSYQEKQSVAADRQ